MKQRLFTFGLIVLGMVILSASPAKATTSSNGPYYAMPSWDQQLPASTRFIVLSNWASPGAVLDRETGLVWELSPSTSTFVWEDAHTQCNQLTTGGRLVWRIPTIQEFASLVDPTQTSPALPSGNPFNNVQSTQPYWSATTSGSDSTLAWGVRLSTGGVSTFGKGFTAFVWCVRGGQGVNPQ